MSHKVGQRVEIAGKDCQGVIAFVGHPSFATGKWIGVILDEPKGKNNGTIKGQSYFKCPENHGMFVKQSQIILLDESGNKMEPVSPSSAGSSATTPDDSSTARARSRMNSSRLSLAGSRTQLSAPSTENLTTSQHERKGGTESQIPAPTSTKRASFIEKSPSTSSPPGKKPKAQDDHNNTGFVETLKPQFVPGQALAGTVLSSNMEEKLSHLQLAQENDNLKAQVRELNEKLETLRVKRMQDKEKMKDFEKTKLQFEQLLEFKTKVMESQGSLQRDLQRARQEAREAHTARQQYEDEMADLAETVEMATLDKEMAEEKAETLQIELDQLKEKLEEQTLDLEILRAEMSEISGGANTATTGQTSYEVKQLEQQNSRLRETLVKMRDLSAHEKHEFQKLLKDMDQKKSEILELGRTKEKLSARVEEMEHQIADLQEQVDAALGAEEMVEVLGERKMALEEKVAELEEAVSDLEALQDMSDQLAESSKELELELREELDLALGLARDAQRERDAALETLADRELTITKFRELTHQLQDQCLQLQQRVQSTESVKSGSRGADQLAEILDFQKTFAETRAQTKAVDLELRRLDAEEARNHVRYLLSFMPPTFLARGGDHDAILTLLLIPRMTYKTEILISQVRDKYRSIEKIDKAAVIKGHAVAQYSFRSRLTSHMYALQTALGSFDSALNVCSPETLLKVGAAYPEMASQEKSLDSLIELAKRDQLDENLPTDAIEKCSAYFSTMFSVLFGESTYANQARLVVNGTRSLGSACDAIATDAAAIKSLIQGDGGDIGLLCQHLETSCEVIQQHLKSARRRVPRDQITATTLAGANLGLDNDWNEQLLTSSQHAVKITKTLQDLLKNALQAIVANGDLETGLPADKLKEMAAMSSEKIYDTEDIGPIATIKASLTIIQQMAANLAQKMAECENELAISGQTHARQSNENEQTTPILIRAQIARKESEETKILSRKLEARDSSIREARVALREKQEEISEMALRKDLVEKKLATQQHEHELNIEKYKRKLEEAQNQLKRKEKEFEETMDHLQTDIDSLESEKGQLKEKLKSIGKKTTTTVSGQEGILNNSNVTTPIMSLSDNGLLLQEIAALKEALNNEQQQKRKLLADNLRQQLEKLEPLPILVKSKLPDPKLVELQHKRDQLVKELQKAMIFPTVPDLSRNTTLAKEAPILEKALPAYQLLQRQTAMKQLKERADQLANEVREETVKRTLGGRAEANFAVFPNREMAAAMYEKDKLLAAQINIPYKGSPDSFEVNVGTQELRKIHALLCY